MANKKDILYKTLMAGSVVGSCVGIFCGVASGALIAFGRHTGRLPLPAAKVNTIPTKKEWADKAVKIIGEKVQPEVFVPAGTDTEAFGEELRTVTDKHWNAIGDVIDEFEDAYDGELYVWVNKGPGDGYGIGFVNQDLANALYDYFKSGACLDRAIIKCPVV